MPSSRPNDAISYNVHTITRSESGVSYRWPRVWSQEDRVLQDPRQRGVPCTSAAFRRSLFRVPRAGKTWLVWLFHVTFGKQYNLLSLFLNALAHVRELLNDAVGAVDAAWAASCDDDTTSGVSLAIEGPGRSMICSTVCSAKEVTGCADATCPISGAGATCSIAGPGGTPGSGEMSSITGASAVF